MSGRWNGTNGKAYPPVERAIQRTIDRGGTLAPATPPAAIARSTPLVDLPDRPAPPPAARPDASPDPGRPLIISVHGQGIDVDVRIEPATSAGALRALLERAGAALTAIPTLARPSPGSPDASPDASSIRAMFDAFARSLTAPQIEQLSATLTSEQLALLVGMAQAADVGEVVAQVALGRADVVAGMGDDELDLWAQEIAQARDQRAERRS